MGEEPKTITISLETPLTQTYIVHAALLAVKLLALSPMAAVTWVNKGIFPNVDIVRRAYLSELKNLAPFWIVGALYLTTTPPIHVGISLFRTYTVARIIMIFGYATRPVPAAISDFALVTSYITANRPDIVLVDRSMRRAINVNITIPHDDNLVKAEKEKVSKYLDLAHEITAMWNVESTVIVPIVVSVSREKLRPTS
ncbi:jg15288 [Pararge aegeria aegeria]|uniref:Jg15288 protein n=1 Tax=Pararge aegeria aegeria TaxID=348720 RepID=A0A8S4R406_9NEOP|nr:jg15288 [Pararge aegeria aegeria]